MGVEIIAALVVSAGMVAFGRLVRRPGKLERTIARTPRVALADLADGATARVVGRAGKLDEVLEAPLTGRPCLYYRLTIEEMRRGTYHVLAEENRAVLFTLEDGSGRAIVDPSRSIVALDEDGNGESGMLDPPTEREAALLARHDVNNRGIVLARKLRYFESIIEVGETIAIVGSAVREPDPDAPPEAAYRGAPATILRMTSARKQPMIISDRPLATR